MAEFAGKLPYGKTQCTLREAVERMENYKNFNASNLHGVTVGGFYIVSSYNTIIGLANDGLKTLYINSKNYGSATAHHKALIKKAFWNYQVIEIEENGFDKAFWGCI